MEILLQHWPLLVAAAFAGLLWKSGDKAVWQILLGRLKSQRPPEVVSNHEHPECVAKLVQEAEHVAARNFDVAIKIDQGGSQVAVTKRRPMVSGDPA